MLVDDHAVLRAGLRALFDQQADMEVVAEGGTVAEAREQALAVSPDLVLADMTLPGGGGMTLIETLTKCQPAPRILVLTMHDDPAYARAALAAGATGYVVKTVGERDLLTAVRAVYRGQIFVDLDDESKTSAVFASSRDSMPAAKLSERELEVLKLLGRGFGNQDVADRLELSPKTVATYKARIGEKLGLKTTAEFVKYMADTGIGESVEQ